MKFKKILFLLLAMALCLSLAACGETPDEDEALRKDLTAMSDEELTATLLANYEAYEEPGVFVGETSWLYRSGDSVVASMTGSVRSNGAARTLTRTVTVGESSRTETCTYVGGVCYFHHNKTKASAEADQVSACFAARYPQFGKVSEYYFARKDLLRSEDGTYLLVLSSPSAGIAPSADITGPLTAAGNETAPVTLSGYSDIYLTLLFSAEGKLTGQTLGFDCKMTADGIETEGEVLFKFRITSTDPVQNVISAPDGGDAFGAPETDPFAPPAAPDTEPEGDGEEG